MHLGEGRVHTIGAIVEAERTSRPGARVLVFERGGALHVDGGVAAPDHRGLAGTFAALLGHSDVTTIAVLPSELYLPARSPSISGAIARYLRTSVIGVDLPSGLSELVSAGLDLDDRYRTAIADRARESVADYLATLGDADSARVAELHRTVLGPLRRLVRSWSSEPGFAPADRAALADRLSRRHLHLRAWIAAFCDHVALAAKFDLAATACVHAADGSGKLQDALDAAIAGAVPRPPKATAPAALVVPHAGYVYSGPVAASGTCGPNPCAARSGESCCSGPVIACPCAASR